MRTYLHNCPGGCGAPIPHHLFACSTCWKRLPLGLRTPILDAALSNLVGLHSQAMELARRWFRENS